MYMEAHTKVGMRKQKGYMKIRSLRIYEEDMPFLLDEQRAA